MMYVLIFGHHRVSSGALPRGAGAGRLLERTCGRVRGTGALGSGIHSCFVEHHVIPLGARPRGLPAGLSGSLTAANFVLRGFIGLTRLLPSSTLLLFAALPALPAQSNRSLRRPLSRPRPSTGPPAPERLPMWAGAGKPRMPPLLQGPGATLGPLARQVRTRLGPFLPSSRGMPPTTARATPAPRKARFANRGFVLPTELRCTMPRALPLPLSLIHI